MVLPVSPMSTKVCCHQSSAHRSPQSKEKLYPDKQQTEKTQPLEETKSVLCQDKGKTSFSREGPALIPDYLSLCK